jgi:hypothetical protein
MRRTAILFFLLTAAAACGPADSANRSPAAATQPAPVFVPALCTLMGQSARSNVPAGHPVVLIWGWTADTEEQVKDYLLVGSVVVTFDGVERKGRQQGGIPYDEEERVYRAVWMAEVGIPEPGVHTITYTQTFAAKIFDGRVYYGPGTDNEKMEDRCEIVVR